MFFKEQLQYSEEETQDLLSTYLYFRYDCRYSIDYYLSYNKETEDILTAQHLAELKECYALAKDQMKVICDRIDAWYIARKNATPKEHEDAYDTHAALMLDAMALIIWYNEI